MLSSEHMVLPELMKLLSKTRVFCREMKAKQFRKEVLCVKFRDEEEKEKKERGRRKKQEKFGFLNLRVNGRVMIHCDSHSRKARNCCG